MAQQDLLELARKGDPQAIADLMNRSLQPKGIIAKVSISGDCLMLTTEGQEAPEQIAMVDFVRKGMTSLNNESIKRVIVRGQAAGSNTPKWRETLNLNGNSAASPVSTPGPQSSPAPASSGFVGKLRSINVPAATNSLLLFGILIATLLNLVVPKKPAAVQWEYKVDSIEDYSFDSTIRRLGENGWEIASARRATTGEGDSSRGLYEVIFKRPTYVSQWEIAAREKREALEAEELLGEMQMHSIIRAEQAYHIENSNLAAAIDSLGLGNPPPTSYTYNLAIEDPSKAVITGITTNKKLSSYTGAVFVSKVDATDEAVTLAILCKPDKVSQTPPASPQLVDNKPQCPTGSSEVK
jgi:hypothetical protein